MYVILSVNRIRPEYLDEFVTNVREHARSSNNEPGCLRYEVLQDTTDPQTVCLYEVFRDETAFAEHQTADYYKRWMASSRDWRYDEQRIRHVLDFIHTPLDG